MLTIDSDVFVQIEVLDGVTESLDVQLALEMPNKGLGVEHVTRELGERGSISDLEATLQVQGTMSATGLQPRKSGKGEKGEQGHSCENAATSCRQEASER